MEQIYSFLSTGMDQRPAYGYSHRLRAAVYKDQVTPSPLDYYAERVNLHTSPSAYTFGSRPKLTKKVSVTPGPGEYFIAEELPERSKSGYSFGSVTRTKRRHSNVGTPGPKYSIDVESIFQPKRGFTFGHRTRFDRRRSDTPGPGEYETESLHLKPSTPAFTFGVKNYKQEQNESRRSKTPAPLEYFGQPEVTMKSSPAYTFGKKSRGKVFVCDDFDSPGTGEYEAIEPRFTSTRKGFSFGLRVSRVTTSNKIITEINFSSSCLRLLSEA